jgi:hypothetical protein
MGDAYADTDLVFCRENGTIVHPDAFSDAFWRHVKAAKLPRIRFHDLRHTHATLALAAGVSSQGGVRAAGTRAHHDHARHVLARDSCRRQRRRLSPRSSSSPTLSRVSPVDDGVVDDRRHRGVHPVLAPLVIDFVRSWQTGAFCESK